MSFVFEESGAQICRNARSVGLDLARHVESGLLRFQAARPTLYGLETHLASMHRDIERFEPRLVVIDPISALKGPPTELQATLLRMVDMLKARGITAVFTTLREDGGINERADLGLSSLMDAWVKLQSVEANGERTRTLYVIKARGMSHSNQVREFQMGASGVRLVDAYVGPAGVLTGTARLVREAQEKAEDQRRVEETERRKRDILRRRQGIERQIAELRASLEVAEEEETVLLGEDDAREALLAGERRVITQRRSAAE